MILKGSQRAGARQLAAHLLNDRDNDHITIEEMRGFVANDLLGAMTEAHAISLGTQCRQPVFSLSLSPPKDANASVDDLRDAMTRAEKVLGLEGQPCALVVHEKNGRRHAHAVWSRIDADTMKAINLPFFKKRLNALSKELYLEHGWSLPDGHKTNGWKNPLNFTLAEWQKAKRLDLDPREIKQIFRDAWDRSDSLPGFKAALEEHGYYLAKGDRRGVVALDIHGEVFAAARWAGVKTRDMDRRLGPANELPSVDSVREHLRARVSQKLRGFIAEDRRGKQEELKPLTDARDQMVTAQRAERDLLSRRQEERTRAEAAQRAAKFRRGLGVVMDVLTGRLFQTRRENEREAYQGLLRDRAQREALYAEQMKEREALQRRIEATRTRHRQERMLLARQIADVIALDRQTSRSKTPNRTRGDELGLEL